MPAYQEFEARILVDDEPLPEYAPTLEVGADGVMTASCWVPSEAGKSFYMRWTDNRHPRVATHGRVIVDGVEVGGRIIRADTGPFRLARDVPEAIFRGPHRAGGEYTKLVFSALELTDADDALPAAAGAAIGEAALTLRSIVISQAYDDPNGIEPVSGALSSGKLHERSKKAGVHRVQLGATIKTLTRTRMVHFDHLPDPPLVRFLFRYRPLALLQANGIAPPPPPPPPPGPPPADANANVGGDAGGDADVKPDIDDADAGLTPAQLAEIAALEAQVARLRAAGAAGRVKQEPLSHRGVFEQGAVIDLTDDD